LIGEIEVGNKNERLSKILMIADWDWDNPEDVYDKWIRKDHDAAGSFLAEIYENCDDKKLQSLYFNYEYFENQILAFVESDSRAYDKARWVLKQYFEHLTGGIPDQIETKYDGTRAFFCPEFGETRDWIQFIEAMDDVYHNGLNDQNMRSVKKMQMLYDEYLNR
jgi:hypothetical protein